MTQRRGSGDARRWVSGLFLIKRAFPRFACGPVTGPGAHTDWGLRPDIRP
ncbi:hypothetical protein BLA6992_05306 [Burkholderia lata]|nr:hypothetical protein BLA6860_05667 [Burkholderia lata]VWM14504.1 hypothetical protein BLA6992_05306 [Burkholderia lata]